MNPQTLSTITLFTELIVSTIVYYALFQGYVKNKFPTKLAAGALLYELIFNITYMASRVPAHTKPTHIEHPGIIALAIVHGTLSLIMFVALVVFFILAAKNYAKDINYFRSHKILTFLFLFFWTFSIISGIAFYMIEYVF